MSFVIPPKAAVDDRPESSDRRGMIADPSGTPDETPRKNPARIPAPARSSLLACGLVLGGAAVAVFLAGGPSQGSLGIFLVCAGAALVFCPPQRRLPWTLWAAAAALLACGALSYLPENWFGIPAWRHALEAAPAIHLPRTVTPIPWETGFWLALLGVSLLTGLLLLTHPIRSPILLRYALFAVVACGVYAGLAMYAKHSGWHYPFDGGASFGFFPNRNHTATLLMTGSLVAVGVLAITLRDQRWLEAMLAGVGLTLCVMALFFFSTSRGGIVFLLLGVGIWVAGLGRTNRSPQLLVTIGALAVAGIVLLLASGSAVRNRLLSTSISATPPPEHRASLAADGTAGGQPVGTPEDATSDFRLLIWRDTSAMIRDFPLTGSGLGTFADEFGFYRRLSLSESAAIHPESDWLLLTAEAGLPAAVCAAILVLMLSRRLAGLSGHPFWPLRWALAVAAGAAVLHGAVDVPLHRVALGWWVLALGGLGLQAGSGRQRECSRAQQALFVAGGVAALALGGQLIRAEWFGGRALPPFADERAPQEIVKKFDQDGFEAMRMAERAVHASPMSVSLYHLWGVLLLHFEDSDREVEEAFQAERLLNPNWPEIPLRQGDVWAAVDPKRTAALWLESVERQRRASMVHGEASIHGTYVSFAAVVKRAARFPGVAAELAPAAARSPENTLVWLSGTDPAVVQEKLGQILATEGLLARFNPTERQQLLLTWDDRGNRDALAAFLAEHADWQDSATPLRLRELVRAGRYEEAVNAGAERYGISLALPPQDGAQTDTDEPEDTSNPVVGFNRYWRKDNSVTARRILTEGAEDVDAQPWAAEYWRLRAGLAAQDKDWPLAWSSLTRAIRTAQPAAVLP